MYEQVGQNKRRSVVLVIVFVALVVAVAWALSLLLQFGWVGLVVALGIAAVASVGSWWHSDRVALRMSRAERAERADYARLHNLVEGLCIAGGLPKPRIYVIEDEAPNAFATGRNPDHAAIAVTTGLMEKMNRVELEAILAHELSHIKNYDILVSTMAVTLVGALMLAADFGIRFLWWGGGRSRGGDRGGGVGAPIALVGFALLILSPLVAKLLQFSVSRSRESLADLSGVELTRYPPGLISALEKLQADQTVVHAGSRATAHLWIEEPIARARSEGKMSRLNRLFDTHPPLEERIAALREL